MNTVIQTRIDAQTRREAEQVLAEMGLSLNESIRIFLKQVINTRTLPFQPKASVVPNSDVREAMHRVEKHINGSEKEEMSFSTVKDMMVHLLGADE